MKVLFHIYNVVSHFRSPEPMRLEEDERVILQLIICLLLLEPCHIWVACGGSNLGALKVLESD